MILHCPGPVAKNQHLDDTQYTITAFAAISPTSWAIHVSSTGCIMTIFHTARQVSRFMFLLVFRYLIVTLRILSSLLNSTSLIIPYWYVLLRLPSFFRNKITSSTLTSRFTINFGTCDNSQFSNHDLKILLFWRNLLGVVITSIDPTGLWSLLRPNCILLGVIRSRLFKSLQMLPKANGRLLIEFDISAANVSHCKTERHGLQRFFSTESLIWRIFLSTFPWI